MKPILYILAFLVALFLYDATFKYNSRNLHQVRDLKVDDSLPHNPSCTAKQYPLDCNNALIREEAVNAFALGKPLWSIRKIDGVKVKDDICVFAFEKDSSRIVNPVNDLTQRDSHQVLVKNFLFKFKDNKCRWELAGMI